MSKILFEVFLIFLTTYRADGFEFCSTDECPEGTTHCVLIHHEETCVTLEKAEPEIDSCVDVSCNDDLSCVVLNEQAYCYAIVQANPGNDDNGEWDNCSLEDCPDETTHCKMIDYEQTCMVTEMVQPLADKCTEVTCDDSDYNFCIVMDGLAYCYNPIYEEEWDRKGGKKGKGNKKHKENKTLEVNKRHKGNERYSLVWDCPLDGCPRAATHCKVIDYEKTCMVAEKLDPPAYKCVEEVCGDTEYNHCIVMKGQVYCYNESFADKKKKQKGNQKHRNSKTHKGNRNGNR